MRSPAPAPPIAASLILPAIFLGSQLCTGAPYFFLFFSFFNSFWIFSFCSSLLFLLSFSTSSYSFVFSLLILLVSTILRLLILFSYILIGCCITDMHINEIHISVILRGFSRGPSLF